MTYRRRRRFGRGRKRYNAMKSRLYRGSFGGHPIQYQTRTLINHRTHYFKRTALKILDVNPSTIGRISYWANSGWTNGTSDDAFLLSYLTNVSEITNLFDMYKINGIKMKFIFDRNSAQSSVATESLPTLYFYNDYDDGVVPINLGEACQYETLRIKRLDKPATFFFKPKIQSMIYNTAITTAYATPKINPWLDCGNPNVPHYGCKWILDTNTAFNASIGALTVIMTYYIACKDVR